MAYWLCFYHIVWATHHRQPMILLEYETMIAEKIHEKSRTLKCHVHAVNMMPDHVHVAVSIRPAIAVSQWVQHAKGGTAYDLKRDFDLQEPFKWQKSYGVVTYGEKQLPYVLAYIDNQKLHHKQQTTQLKLEQDDTYYD